MEKRERERERERERKESRPPPFIKSLLGASVPPPHPSPPAKSDVWPTMLNREQKGYQKSHPGGDHYYVGCLGQTCVSLPE